MRVSATPIIGRSAPFMLEEEQQEGQEPHPRRAVDHRGSRGGSGKPPAAAGGASSLGFLDPIARRHGRRRPARRGIAAAAASRPTMPIAVVAPATAGRVRSQAVAAGRPCRRDRRRRPCARQRRARPRAQEGLQATEVRRDQGAGQLDPSRRSTSAAISIQNPWLAPAMHSPIPASARARPRRRAAQINSAITRSRRLEPGHRSDTEGSG